MSRTRLFRAAVASAAAACARSASARARPDAAARAPATPSVRPSARRAFAAETRRRAADRWRPGPPHARGLAARRCTSGGRAGGERTRATELVGFNQPRAGCGRATAADFVERGDPLARRHPARPARAVNVGVDLLDLFRLELPLDLQHAHVAEQRALVRGQAIGLALQCLQAIGGTARQRFGARAIGLGPPRAATDAKAARKETPDAFKERRNYNIVVCACLASTSALGASVSRSAIRRGRSRVR